jgi:anaerobic selenocysteine-containing dehydrogenase
MPRVTAVDGSQRNPYTDGFICAKVRRYPERIYSPLRLLHPQRRVGAKGEGRFERIGWDEAIALIATRFKQIIASDGCRAILPLSLRWLERCVRRGRDGCPLLPPGSAPPSC